MVKYFNLALYIIWLAFTNTVMLLPCILLKNSVHPGG